MATVASGREAGSDCRLGVGVSSTPVSPESTIFHAPDEFMTEFMKILRDAPVTARTLLMRVLC